jgi:hypothetical protein
MIGFVSVLRAVRAYTLSAIILVPVAALGQQQDHFVGELMLRDNDPNGRYFELMAPFGYVDPAGARWQAEKGLVTDGASIPQVLWSIVGGPYEGRYRRAAIIHDFYCDRKYRSWERVHRVFYDAMLTGEVGPLKAGLMYYAVWRFGPRWSVAEIMPCVPNPALGKFCADSKPIALQITAERPIVGLEDLASARQELADVSAHIERDNPTIEQLQQLGDSKSPLPRRRTFFHEEVTSGTSLAPFSNYKLVEQSTPLPLPQDLPILFPVP